MEYIVGRNWRFCTGEINNKKVYAYVICAGVEGRDCANSLRTFSTHYRLLSALPYSQQIPALQSFLDDVIQRLQESAVLWCGCSDPEGLLVLLCRSLLYLYQYSSASMLTMLMGSIGSGILSFPEVVRRLAMWDDYSPVCLSQRQFSILPLKEEPPCPDFSAVPDFEEFGSVFCRVLPHVRVKLVLGHRSGGNPVYVLQDLFLSCYEKWSEFRRRVCLLYPALEGEFVLLLRGRPVEDREIVLRDLCVDMLGLVVGLVCRPTHLSGVPRYILEGTVPPLWIDMLCGVVCTNEEGLMERYSDFPGPVAEPVLLIGGVGLYLPELSDVHSIPLEPLAMVSYLTYDRLCSFSSLVTPLHDVGEEGWDGWSLLCYCRVAPGAGVRVIVSGYCDHSALIIMLLYVYKGLFSVETSYRYVLQTLRGLLPAREKYREILEDWVRKMPIDRGAHFRLDASF